MSKLSDAIERCARAYASNNIPWDTVLGRLPIHKLEELADYWEARAKDPCPKPRGCVGIDPDLLTIANCVSLIREVQPTPPNGTPRGSRVHRAECSYHGGYRD